MVNTESIAIRVAQWPQEKALLRGLRDRVFVQEQRVPKEIEWDDQDDDAIHFIAFSQQGDAIATARLLPSGQLGRMAVLPEWRNQKIGTQVLQFVLNWATAQHVSLFLHAQVKALSFYERAGFVAYGKRFTEAGIEHQSMQLGLSNLNSEADA